MSLILLRANAASNRGGGHAGHNGLRSIHGHIGEAYGRVRLGIGHPGHKDAVAGYVLHDFPKADADWLDDLLRGIADGAPHLAEGDAGKFHERGCAARGPGAVVENADAITFQGRGAKARFQATTGTGRPQPAAKADGQVQVTLNDALLRQAQSCAALDSPFMARVLPILAKVWPMGSALDKAVAAFEGDISPNGHSLPLRLAAGLHALVLTGQDMELAAVYPPNAVSDDRLGAALTSALAVHAAFLIDWIASAPQTNEVRRSAVLIAGTHALVQRTGVAQVHLSELGASAGLNLMFDQYALVAGDTRLGPEEAALTLAPGLGRANACKRAF